MTIEDAHRYVDALAHTLPRDQETVVVPAEVYDAIDAYMLSYPYMRYTNPHEPRPNLRAIGGRCMVRGD